MALTPSTTMPLGTAAPDFSLPEPSSGTWRTLTELRGDRATLVMFICNHCPYVKHIEQGLIDFARDYRDKGLGIIAISANDADNYPEDGPEQIAAARYPFAYLYDESQQVARAYDAAHTPDLFLFDAQLQCVYRGQFDASRPGSGEPVTGGDLRSAVDQLLEHGHIDMEQVPGIGCSIKWK
ncbi:thioredoxin family protein [Exilibacterium tricleocarpae]|uniref:Thioredoxin family protein n=1 Tax=Exilibacterium tricleocarpae TaxID=2591008 RepID=A0A545SY75_9GAMM|nr:thioredoxin family protein [Exilibacterium tricleocarpae]TQV69889.1 thioredoxin family protein [Exilibacterium tricleocarpae]